jgi:iron complex outermembrane recepter protein
MFAKNKKWLLTAAVCQAVGVSSVVSADDSFTLEEVVVTATKRAVGMQDVPIAMSVMGGDKIEKNSISNLEDLSIYMPSVHIGESGSANQVFIRGIGSGNNQGFEQSVGTFIDGVYYGRARNSRAAFLDLERVEVLKGPQSTLFGKNTIAGAINITTAKPTDEFTGYVEGTYDETLGGTGVTAMVSGPLSDTVRGRLVAKTYEDDGWMDNQAPGKDGPSKETNVLRGTLEWDATDALQLSLKVEHGEFDVTGRNMKITDAGATGALFFSGSAPYASTSTDANFSNSLGFNEDQSMSGFAGRPQEDETESDIYQLTADYELGEHTLRSITAYTKYDYENCTDADYGPVAFLDRCREESHKQFTQEFLLSSPIGGAVEYLAGVFYQDAALESDASTMVGLTELDPVNGADAELLNFFEQDSETISAFAEFTFNVSDEFRTIVGLRYSHDEKEAKKRQLVTVPGTGVNNAGLEFLYGDAIPGTTLSFSNAYDYEEERKEDHWTGNLNFQYDLNEDTMMYLNLATGYKAGGFDADNSLDASREFEDESVESIEVGLKTEFMDGRGRLNAAIFSSDYEDVQVSTFETAGFIVGNAAETSVDGAEFDVTFAATQELTLTAALTYLDARYDSFEDAACTWEQRVAAGSGCTQDLSGAQLQFAPDWSGNLSAEYITAIGPDMELTVAADALWTDDVVVANDLDKNVIQKEYWKFNARIQLSSADDTWRVALVGKNLTDETTFNWGNDLTLSGSGYGFEGGYFHHIEKPRTVELQARYSF